MRLELPAPGDDVGGDQETPGRPNIQAIAWKAQVRLCKKYRHLVFNKGKSTQVAITAVARELLGFTWAAACEVETQGLKQASTA